MQNLLFNSLNSGSVGALGPSPCENNGKSTEIAGNNASCCSDKGIVHAQPEKTQAVVLLQFRSMYDGQPNIWQHTQDNTQHPQKTISSPKSQETPDLQGQSRNGTTRFHGSRICGNNTFGCSDKGVVLAMQEGGGGVKPCLSSRPGHRLNPLFAHFWPLHPKIRRNVAKKGPQTLKHGRMTHQSQTHQLLMDGCHKGEASMPLPGACTGLIVWK